MERLPIRFEFDYVDPGSYVAAVLLKRWRDDNGYPRSVEWSALELKPPGARRIDPVAPEWARMTESMRSVAERAGIPFETPLQVPWTRKAHELALHAREKACFEPVHRAVFEAHFVHALDIGRVDVLVGLGEEAGLDPAEVRTVLGVDRFGPAIETLREEALERGIRGVPTLEMGDRRLEGLESAEALHGFLSRAASERDGPRSEGP